MRNALLLSLGLVAAGGVITPGHGAAAQSQPAPTPKPAQTQPQPAPAPKPAAPAPAGQTPAGQAPAPKPAQPTPAAPAGQTPATQPAPRRTTPASASARGGMAITITDGSGNTLGGVSVSADGPTARMGESNGSGQLNFPGLLAGVYRLRFDGETVVSFEKEVTVHGAQVLDVDVKLSPAKRTPPPAPAPISAPPTPASTAANNGPVGEPQFLSIPKVLEGDFVGKNPRRESLLSCSGATRAVMIQVNQPTPERMYADADMVYYVIGGEGTLKLNGKETKLALNDFVSVPRGGSHSFERRGTRALVMLSVLGGEPCDTGR